MSDVFISYSRADRAQAEVLAKALRARGLSVWYDAAIEPGAANFASVVRNELQAARCLVVLWTAKSISSNWVYAEAVEAQEQGKALVPMIVDDVRPPMPFNVMQGIPVKSDGAEVQLGSVVAVVIERLSGLPAGPVPAAEPQLRPRDLGGRRVDARPDPEDLRDLVYLPSPALPMPVFPPDDFLKQVVRTFANSGLSLDTGVEGASAAFAAANLANWFMVTEAMLRGQAGTRQWAPASTRMLWHFGCLQEGPDVDKYGLSCRSVLAGWHRNGVCSERLWPSYGKVGGGEEGRLDGWKDDAARRPLAAYYRVQADQISDIQSAIKTIGSLLVSVVIHKGWLAVAAQARRNNPISHRSLPAVAEAPRRGAVGGHAVAVVGYNERGLVILNSWGRHWGHEGFALLPYDQWLKYGRDAWLVVPAAPIELHANQAAAAGPSKKA